VDSTTNTIMSIRPNPRQLTIRLGAKRILNHFVSDSDGAHPMADSLLHDHQNRAGADEDAAEEHFPRHLFT
jgi:hypothetical protein